MMANAIFSECMDDDDCFGGQEFCADIDMTGYKHGQPYYETTKGCVSEDQCGITVELATNGVPKKATITCSSDFWWGYIVMIVVGVIGLAGFIKSKMGGN